MNHKLTSVLFFCLIAVIQLPAASNNPIQSTNPFLGKFNEVIQFGDLNADNIKENGSIYDEDGGFYLED